MTPHHEIYSRFSDLDAAVRKTGGALPLSWVKSIDGEERSAAVANFGDALSPLISTAISRLPCVHRNFDSASTRLVSVGTIGHSQRLGSLHFWGTGVDAKFNAVDKSIGRFILPPETQFNIHALRGPVSRAAFAANGIDAPEIYGDPAWFLPRILAPKVEKTHELGVIVHISELDGRAIDAKARENFLRYQGGASSGVRVISTFHHASWEGFTAKLAEILSCKRIVSTSFHGLIIPQAYGIPALYFPPAQGGGIEIADLRAHEGKLDHRIADFFAGAGVDKLQAYAQPRLSPTDWEAVIRHLDQAWEPLEPDMRDFLSAFPLQARRSLADEDWSLDEGLMRSMSW